jgi:hypothetical protein
MYRYICVYVQVYVYKCIYVYIKYVYINYIFYLYDLHDGIIYRNLSCHNNNNNNEDNHDNIIKKGKSYGL